MDGRHGHPRLGSQRGTWSSREDESLRAGSSLGPRLARILQMSTPLDGGFDQEEADAAAGAGVEAGLGLIHTAVT
jgi:hypothetical protein